MLCSWIYRHVLFMLPYLHIKRAGFGPFLLCCPWLISCAGALGAKLPGIFVGCDKANSRSNLCLSVGPWMFLWGGLDVAFSRYLCVNWKFDSWRSSSHELAILKLSIQMQNRHTVAEILFWKMWQLSRNLRYMTWASSTILTSSIAGNMGSQDKVCQEWVQPCHSH